MKKLILMSLVCCCSACIIKSPQVINFGYKSHDGIIGEPYLYIIERSFDYLPDKYINEYQSKYYLSLDIKDYMYVYNFIDTTKYSKHGYETRTNIISKKANDGYLYINEKIIKSLSPQKDDFKVYYILNTDTVKKRKDYKTLYSLKEKDICELDKEAVMNKLFVKIRTIPK